MTPAGLRALGCSGIREGRSKVLQLESPPPKMVTTAPCQEVLPKLPGSQVSPGDGGVFHSFGRWR